MDVNELYEKLREHGHFVLMAITVSDVLESEEVDEDTESPITEEEAWSACAYVARKWSYGDEYDNALLWARDIVKEARDAENMADLK